MKIKKDTKCVRGSYKSIKKDIRKLLVRDIKFTNF